MEYFHLLVELVINLKIFSSGEKASSRNHIVTYIDGVGVHSDGGYICFWKNCAPFSLFFTLSS